MGWPAPRSTWRTSSASLQTQVLGFARELHDAMHSIGRLSTQAVAVSDDDAYIRRAAAENDKIFPMLFDEEHYGSGDPGPVSSQRFYVTQAQRFARLVDPSKMILTIGAYGYDWNDAEAVMRHQAEAFDFQEAMRAARGSSRPHSAMDPVSLNPYMQWTDADSTDHVLWYLDATTAYNQMKVGHALGVAGHAIWHLGGEDPSMWSAIGLDGSLLSPDSLRTIPPGYDAELEGTGEILQIQYFPSAGYRNLTVDPHTGYITSASLVQVPVPFVVARTGGQDRNQHRVALTFDDGPDPRWTPMILDTLRSRGVKATFFVVGQNVDTDQRLLERMYDEGHEIGNHTYRHPNLALASGARAVLEIDMTTQLVSSVSTAAWRSSGRRTSETPSRRRATSSYPSASRRDDTTGRSDSTWTRKIGASPARTRSSPTCYASASIRGVSEADPPGLHAQRGAAARFGGRPQRDRCGARPADRHPSSARRHPRAREHPGGNQPRRGDATTPSDDRSDALLHAHRLPRARGRRDASCSGCSVPRWPSGSAVSSSSAFSPSRNGFAGTRSGVRWGLCARREHHRAGIQ